MKATPKRLTLAEAHTRLLTVQQLLRDAQSLLRETQQLHRQIMRLGDTQVREAIRALKRPLINLTVQERKSRGR
jgi:hypothetical protein